MYLCQGKCIFPWEVGAGTLTGCCLRLFALLSRCCFISSHFVWYPFVRYCFFLRLFSLMLCVWGHLSKPDLANLYLKDVSDLTVYFPVVWGCFDLNNYVIILYDVCKLILKPVWYRHMTSQHASVGVLSRYALFWLDANIGVVYCPHAEHNDLQCDLVLKVLPHFTLMCMLRWQCPGDEEVTGDRGVLFVLWHARGSLKIKCLWGGTKVLPVKHN